MKNTIATFALAAIMTLGSTVAFADPGILVSDLTGSTNNCTEKTTKDTGILVSDIIGILVSDFTGILVSDRQAPTTTSCGILVSD